MGTREKADCKSGKDAPRFPLDNRKDEKKSREGSRYTVRTFGRSEGQCKKLLATEGDSSV